jgi:basic membrane protein A and related proteins
MRIRAGFVVASIAMLAACGGDDDGGPGDQTVKAAWVYVGPIGDLGWSYSHNQGRLTVEAELDGVETTYVESVPEDEVEQTIDQLVADGNQLIFTTSYGYIGGTKAAAAKHPDVKFEHCSGFEERDNMASYFGRMYQARYLTGMVAGAMTTSNKICMAASWPIPEVIRHINATALGARRLNPDVEVHVEWVMSWYDPTTEALSTRSLLDGGCDVVIMDSDTTTSIDEAEDKGVYAVGYHTDVRSFGTSTVLTSAVWDWGPHYTRRVKAVQDGSWTRGTYWGSLDEEIIGLGSYGDAVASDVRQQVAAVEQMIIAKEFDAFNGPFNKQNGDPWIAEGADMDDGEKLSSRDFVEGVVGTVPATCDICGGG